MEINTPTRKRNTPRVDLTAMVDLGFLLITFFMLVSAFSKPYVMEVYKPQQGDPLPVPQSKTATILIGPGDMAYCYTLPEELESLTDLSYDSVAYHAGGLRKYIMRRQAEVEAQWGDKDQLFVIIKSMQNASYARLIDVLDELVITGVQRYAIVNEMTVVDSMIME